MAAQPERVLLGAGDAAPVDGILDLVAALHHVPVGVAWPVPPNTVPRIAFHSSRAPRPRRIHPREAAARPRRAVAHECAHPRPRRGHQIARRRSSCASQLVFTQLHHTFDVRAALEMRIVRLLSRPRPRREVARCSAPAQFAVRPARAVDAPLERADNWRTIIGNYTSYEAGL